METSLLLIPAVLGACAGGAGMARRHQSLKLAQLLNARSTSVSELLSVQDTVATQIGAGSYREQVKLSGEIVCAEPLQAPWSGEPCVAFRNTRTALMEVREERTVTDPEGNQRTEVHWERREETLSNLERRCRFALRGGHQHLTIDPEGAELELESVFSECEPANTADTWNTRQLGIRREEAILRPTGTAFVVAECSDGNGEIVLHNPSNNGLFIVRRGSEESFTHAIRRWRRIWMASSWVLTTACVISMVLITR